MKSSEYSIGVFPSQGNSSVQPIEFLILLGGNTRSKEQCPRVGDCDSNFIRVWIDDARYEWKRWRYNGGVDFVFLGALN